MEITDPDIYIPVAIILACLAVAAAVHFLTRPKPSSISVPRIAEPASAARRSPAVAATPDVQVHASAELAAHQLQQWHLSYGSSIQAWIQNHEVLLDEITDGGLDIYSVSAEITERHEQLAPVIKDAIEAHPAPDMRAQLSAMIVASQATLHALHRNQYEAAERQHLTYLEYRDPWLHRLRQFSANDTNANEIRSLADQHRTTPGW